MRAMSAFRMTSMASAGLVLLATIVSVVAASSALIFGSPLSPLIPAGVILAALFTVYIFSYAAQYRDQWSNQLPARYLSASLFARERIPSGVKVGTFQSGCHSYWLDNRVVNLDGVVNRGVDRCGAARGECR